MTKAFVPDGVTLIEGQLDGEVAVPVHALNWKPASVLANVVVRPGSGMVKLVNDMAVGVAVACTRYTAKFDP